MNSTSKKVILIGLVVFVVIVGAVIFVYFRSQNEHQYKTLTVNDAKAVAEKSAFEKERNDQIAYAKKVYGQLKTAGLSFKNGPCLSNGQEWVVDVAHNPREPIDDNPANQCPAYVSGQAKHFVELDPDGNLIRAQ